MSITGPNVVRQFADLDNTNPYNTNKVTGGASGGGTDALVSGRLYIVQVTSYSAGAAELPTSVVFDPGGADELTFAKVTDGTDNAEQTGYGTTGQTHSLWYAFAPGNTAASFWRVTFGATQSACQIAVSDYQGVDTTTPFPQVVLNTGTSAAADATMGTFGATDNVALLAVARDDHNTSFTPDESRSEAYDYTDAERTTMCLHYQNPHGSDTSLTATLSSSDDWAAIGVELKAAAAGGAEMAAAVTCAVTVSASLTTEIRMAAAVTVAVTASAALTTEIRMASAVSLTVNATGALTTDITMASAVTVAITATADLSVQSLFEAAVSVTVSAAADLTTEITMVSAVTLAVTTTAALTTDITMASSVTVAVTAAGSLTTDITMAGSATVAVTATADLTAGAAAALLESAVTLSVTTAGTLTTEIRLAGAVACTVTTTADLTAQIAFASSVTCAVTATGALTTDITVTAAVTVAVTATGDLSVVVVVELALHVADFGQVRYPTVETSGPRYRFEDHSRTVHHTTETGG